ncbi:MAG: hypothetical protein ACYDBJ_23050 [Aggregatilineales bacterium]
MPNANVFSVPRSGIFSKWQRKLQIANWAHFNYWGEYEPQPLNSALQVIQRSGDGYLTGGGQRFGRQSQSDQL